MSGGEEIPSTKRELGTTRLRSHATSSSLTTPTPPRFRTLRTSNGTSLGEEVGTQRIRCGEMGKADGEGVCRVGGGGFVEGE